MHRPSLAIVTPALADANNGNWQTARRWSRMLGAAYRVELAAGWAGGDEALMIALHARRSAVSILAWREAHPRRPLIVVLTGTDLYRDIDTAGEARESLEAADALIVLNERGTQRLPPALRGRCHVVLQSCTAQRPVPKSDRHLRVLMVGHLRDEKDPATYWRAAARLAARVDVRFDHVGAALDAELGAQAAAFAATHPHFRWLGAQTHGQTRRRIRAAHVLVHPSRMEGGAHVVIEALRCGTPVIASRIDGNLGLLGGDHPAAFAVGDDAALACLIERARDDPAMLPELRRHGDLRAPLFAPQAEAAALHRLVAQLIHEAPETDDERT